MYTNRNRILRFLSVGGLCWVIQYGILRFLMVEGSTAWTANLIGFAASAQLNFFLSHTFTWNDTIEGRRNRLLIAWLGFTAVAMIALVVNTAVFVFVSPYISIIAGVILAGAASTATTYLCNNRFVFSPKGLT